MIIEVIFKGLTMIVKILFTAIRAAFPQVSLPLAYASFLSLILSTTTQANNFIYFILGDTAYILLPSVILLLTYKYIVYPVLSLIVGLVVNKVS